MIDDKIVDPLRNGRRNTGRFHDMMPPLVDVYACYDQLEAVRAQGLLESNGIQCRLIDRASSAIPLTIGKFGEKRISVPHDSVIQAKQLLAAAIRDGYLSTGGNFCGARVETGPS